MLLVILSNQGGRLRLGRPTSADDEGHEGRRVGEPRPRAPPSTKSTSPDASPKAPAPASPTGSSRLRPSRSKSPRCPLRFPPPTKYAGTRAWPSLSLPDREPSFISMNPPTRSSVLLSMTGFGEARLQDERWSVSVEVRTVNNRHLKLSAKISDPYGALEPDLERLVRETIRRGTVQLVLRVDRPRRAEDYRLNAVALTSYRDQLRRLARPSDVRSTSLSSLWPARRGRGAAARRPTTRTRTGPHSRPGRRRGPGEAPGGAGRGRAAPWPHELLALGQGGRPTTSDQIADRGPEVVAAYQKRLTERVQALVAGQGVTIEPKDLIREVAIFAERADIAEEIVRLRAHLAPVHRRDPRARERRPEAGIRRPGDGPRDQHDRLEGQRRRDQPVRRRDQGAAGEDPRVDPERGMMDTAADDRVRLGFMDERSFSKSFVGRCWILFRRSRWTIGRTCRAG